jgi:hypothetical protein
MKSLKKKRVRRKSSLAALPQESVSEIRGMLKDAKLSFRAEPPPSAIPKKIHPRRPLPAIPDDNSDP